jgi:hypothetical protein
MRKKNKDNDKFSSLKVKMVAVMAVMFVSVVMANQRFIISYHLDCRS